MSDADILEADAASLSVMQLQNFLRGRGVSTEGCDRKSRLVDLFVSLQHDVRAGQTGEEAANCWLRDDAASLTPKRQRDPDDDADQQPQPQRRRRSSSERFRSSDVRNEPDVIADNDINDLVTQDPSDSLLCSPGHAAPERAGAADEDLQDDADAALDREPDETPQQQEQLGWSQVVGFSAFTTAVLGTALVVVWNLL